ncbi:MAG TPA: hypothetical protein VM600_07065, partial [Actinomycetota bacterium]|nr:hypothetical protein [Actinomycetota bacterium]
MRARPLMLVVVAVCSGLLPHAGAAVPASYAAPFTSASAIGECGGDVVSEVTGGHPASLSSCSAEATADERSGHMHIDLDIESPLDGTVPAARNARANGEIVLDIPNASTLFEIPVSVRLQVTGAQIARSGQIRPYGEDLSETFLS